MSVDKIDAISYNARVPNLVVAVPYMCSCRKRTFGEQYKKVADKIFCIQQTTPPGGNRTGLFE